MIHEPWRIQMLGVLRLRQGERTLTRFRSYQTGALLAYLAYHLGRSHPRTVLIELFWPEVPPEKGRHNLSNALSSLRNQLEPPGVPAGSVIVADRLSVELSPAAVTTDVEAFEQALRHAAQAKGGTGSTATAEPAEHLTRAVESYGGPLLPGYYEEWITPEQERLAGRFQDALLQLVRLHEQHGATETALEYARRAVSADPAEEEAHRQVMLLLLARGEPAAALRQYRKLERRLREELGEEPAPATRQLLRQIEGQLAHRETPAASPFVPPAAEPTSLPSSISKAVRLLPSGTVTFLLTDVEDSTAGWRRAGGAFRAALERHHALIRACALKHTGHEVKEGGDGFVVAFGRASDALACALEAQKVLAAEPWPQGIGKLAVRMAVHTGQASAEAHEGNYHGLVLSRADRILSAAHGGQVLCSATTAELLRRNQDPSVTLTDLGLYRLRGLDEPERLFLVQYEGMAATAGRGVPPPAAERAHGGGSVPLQFTRFFGREKEIAQIERLVLAPEVRLVTLTGSGGTGKTRLALEAAGRLLDPLAGAVWFTPLADLSDPAQIAGAVRDALQLPRTGQMDPLEQTVMFLSQQNSALLLLDNFEHLIEGGAELVQALLTRVPTLTCLMTSRQVLSLPGEREFPVPPLPTPRGANGPEQLGLFESVQLFADRAQAVKPDFQVTNQNTAALAELCDRLEGIPLAIELAAARAQVLTPVHMLAGLGRRFEFLVSRQRGVVERQRTLRATVDWSYRLLSPELQRFFACLSVFHGGWTAEAAEQVCEEPLALDYLAQLRDCSLVLTYDTGGEMRFRMLETLRKFADQQLSPGERDAVRRRHAQHYFWLAEESETHHYKPEQEQWWDRLETEHENLRAALRWYLEDPGGAEAGLRLVGALCTLWQVRGHFEEGREHVSVALRRAGATEPTAVRAKALRGAGELAWVQGDYTSMRAFFEEALGILRDLGDKGGGAASLRYLAEGAHHEGDRARARSLFEQALTIYRELGQTPHVAESLLSIGGLALDQNDHPSARAFFEEGLGLCRQSGDLWTAGCSLHALGDLAQRQGEDAQARAFHEEALKTFRELGEESGVAMSLGAVGNVVQSQGDYEAAEAFHQEALAIWRELDRKPRIVAPLRSLGRPALCRGDDASAGAFFREELALRQDLGQNHEIPLCLEALAVLAARQGRPESAIRLGGAAEALRESTGTPAVEGDKREEHDQEIAALRAALGEKVFTTAWAQGRAMSMEQAVAYALDEGKEQKEQDV